MAFTLSDLNGEWLSSFSLNVQHLVNNVNIVMLWYHICTPPIVIVLIFLLWWSRGLQIMVWINICHVESDWDCFYITKAKSTHVFMPTYGAVMKLIFYYLLSMDISESNVIIDLISFMFSISILCLWNTTTGINLFYCLVVGTFIGLLVCMRLCVWQCVCVTVCSRNGSIISGMFVLAPWCEILH